MVIPEWQAVRVPDGVSMEDAAAVLEQGMTAHYLCYSTYELRAGDTCLVHAGAGGVGRLLIQMAKQLGATVIHDGLDRAEGGNGALRRSRPRRAVHRAGLP